MQSFICSACRNAAETLTIDTITIQFESSIIQHEIDSTARLFTEDLDAFPEFVEVVSEDILLGCCEVVTARGLKGFDLLFRHVNEEGEIGRVTPEANYSSCEIR